MKEVYLSLVLCCLFIFPLVSLAHELEVDGGMSVVLHVDPEDRPVVNEPALLRFAVVDKTDRFRFSQCECAVVIENIQTKTLVQADQTRQELTYVVRFPSPGVYAVRFIAASRHEAVFDDIAVHFEVRVENNRPIVLNYSSHQRGLHIAILGGGSVFVLGMIIQDKLKRRKK